MNNSERNRRHRGFTLIELMVIVGAIALLATIVLGITISKGQKKAVISSYKTSMQSLRRGMELCKDYFKGLPPQTVTAAPLSQICGSSERFPSITTKCHEEVMNFRYTIGTGGAWAFTSSNSSGAPIDCRGCQLICDENECVPTAGSAC